MPGSEAGRGICKPTALLSPLISMWGTVLIFLCCVFSESKVNRPVRNGVYMYRCIFECIHIHTYPIWVLQIIAFFPPPPASPCFFLTNEEVWKSAQEPWGPGLKLWIIFQPQDFLRFRKSQCYFKGKWAVWIYPHQPPTSSIECVSFLLFLRNSRQKDPCTLLTQREV